MISLKFLMAMLIILICMEAVARLSPHVVGRVVHQRFQYSERLCRTHCENQGKMIRWIANENGARGPLYHNQPVRIAVFGTSTSADSMLDQDQSMFEQLRKQLGADIVHVDNYARDGSSNNEAEIIMNYFHDIGRRYDIVLIMVHPLNRKVDEKTAFHYWGQWSSNGMIKFPTLLRRRVKEQVKTEPRLNRIDRFVHDSWLNTKSQLLAGLSRTDRRAIRTQATFVDIDRPLSPSKKQRIELSMTTLLEAASRTTDCVYLLLQPVAYDETEHPLVAKRWYALRRIKDRDNAYKSNKSIAESIRNANSAMEDVASRRRIPVIDLDGYMRPMLRHRYDLFEDKWHFAPAGAQIAAAFIAERLRPYVNELADNNSDASQPTASIPQAPSGNKKP